MSEKDTANNTRPGGGEGTLNEPTWSGAQGAAPNAAQRSAAQASPARERATGSLPRILLVEDDDTLASLEAGMLTAHGYAVEIASSGEMAITALQEAIPDLVLLDLDLSGSVTGWDVLLVLRRYSRTPVLLTSAESAVHRHIRMRGESRLTLDHLPKPYPLQTLLKRIERMLAIAP